MDTTQPPSGSTDIMLSHLALLPEESSADGAHAAFTVTNVSALPLQLAPSSDLPLIVVAVIRSSAGGSLQPSTAASLPPVATSTGALVAERQLTPAPVSSSSVEIEGAPVSQRRPHP